MKDIKEVLTYTKLKEINIRNELSAIDFEYQRTKEFRGQLKALEKLPKSDVSTIIMYLINEQNNKPSINKEDFELLAYYDEISKLLSYIVD